MYNRDKIMQTLRNIVKEADVIEPYVIVAQPRRSRAEPPAQSFNAYGLCHIDFMGYSMGFVDIEGELVDVARNYLIDRALESKAKYLFFVGDDTVIPYDGFKRLHETAEKNPNSMVVGVYYVKCGGPMIDIREENYIKEANVDPGQLFEIWQGGLDCALIPISLLRDLKNKEPELPFCCVANGIEDIPFVGEDNFFYYRLREAGYKILCDTNIQCLHMDLATGKYTAHPSVNLENYFTNIEPTDRLTLLDKRYIDKRWNSRLPVGTGNKHMIPGIAIPKLLEENNIANPVGIEIGTAEGYTTEYLLKTLPNMLLFGIDPYEQYVDWNGDSKPKQEEKEMFLMKIMQYAQQKKYHHLLMTSDQAIEHFKDETVDFVFVDGLHTYEQVLQDCKNYYSKLKKGGLFCGHDYTKIQAVKDAVDTFAKSIEKEIQTDENDIWYFVK